MAANEQIPVFTSLQDAHPILAIAAREAHRYDQLVQHFRTQFGYPPTHIARAPGRINIIGEHIDYALFGVCPMATEQDVLIACAARPSSTDGHGHVDARNAHPKYTPQVFAPLLTSASKTPSQADDADAVHVVEDPTPSHVKWHLDIDKTQLRWESYVKAGYYGVLERFFAPQGSGRPAPVDMLVTGSVPAGSGLSSSAAMVVASTLAFLAVNSQLAALTKGELVQMAVENERRVGVKSGGMDQAASVTSLPTSALYIAFYPTFAVEPVSLPVEGAVFVCANSLVVSDKVVGARTRYNLRVVETLVAARILARQLNLSSLLSRTDKRFTLREVLSAYLNNVTTEPETPEALEEGLGRLLGEIYRLKGSVLRGQQSSDAEEGLTMEEMVDYSGLERAEFEQAYLSWVDIEATRFQLHRRTQHVFAEARRVLQFRSICLSASSSEDTLRTLGALMDDSQESCSKLYECSCAELDELTALCRRAGAYGSRLTGAGWGGCTISLVPSASVASFIAHLKQGYAPYKDLSEEEFGEAVFATAPGSGAFVFKVEE